MNGAEESCCCSPMRSSTRSSVRRNSRDYRYHTYGIDVDGSIQKQIAEGMKLSNKTILPMFIIGDTFNRVVFVSQGYTIGLGEQLMKVIHKL